MEDLREEADTRVRMNNPVFYGAMGRSDSTDPREQERHDEKLS